jgi:nucleolar pre-ribosomal-associated protein 1
MAIVEQFHAKVQGQLIATDAAVVVLGYLRRVMLGLMGKMDDQKFVMTVLAKLEETCEAAKAKGQERPGLETIIHAMRHDIGLVFGGSDNSTFSETTDFPRLVDEE